MIALLSLGAVLLSSSPGSFTDSTTIAALTWRNVGPWRGGRVTTVTGVRGQPLIYYMGATGGGVWKTTDAGISWRPIGDGQFRMGSIGAVAVAPDDPNVLYVGMGEAPVRGVSSSWGDGMYKSTDAGKRWTRIGLAESRTISRVIIDPRNNDVVYVAAQGSRWGRSAERGVYRTMDGGRSWRLLLASPDTLTGPSDLVMDPTNPRILYAAMWDHQRTPWKVRSGGPNGGIWKSSDGGETWKKLDGGLPKLPGKIGLAVSAASPDRVWAIVEADEGGLWRSDDAGGSWSRVNAERVVQARSWYYMRVVADPKSPDVVYVLNEPVLKSVDGGKSFNRLPDPHGDNHDLWINPDNPANLIKADDGGAAVSFTGGTTWSSIYNQATAQFYRVATDDRWPYWLYAGQQDNTTVAIPSATDLGGIPLETLLDVGGGESAHLAFDPADPRYVYGTSIQGVITEYDATTRFLRDANPYPTAGLGERSDQQKYRFNWSPPVITSPHDRRTIYFGGNVLFRSSDRGFHWAVVSPDLTRNHKARQGEGGGPITNEGAGGEVYGTIYYLAESPHEKGVIWAGTDDGLVQVTRDGGATWSNVTPRGLPESLINMVEVSPHDRATAYIAVSRHKWNDNAPMIYRTGDYGRSWTRIDAGLPAGSPVRVVREDPNWRNLLYAGTETGVFFSLDGGARWQPLQQNLPAVPVTDLQVKRKDLVISTEGRAFWIMDDVTPLHELSDSVAMVPLHLVTPREAYRSSLGGEGGAAFGLGSYQFPNVGSNPPNGAIIDYWLRTKADSTSPVTLEVLDAGGAVVRRFSSAEPGPAEPGAPPVAPKLPAEAGLNRFVWDLRREGIGGVPGTMSGASEGPRVVTGSYQLRMSRAGVRQARTLTVLPDPRSNPSAASLAEQAGFLDSLQQRVDGIHQTVRRLRSVRDQVNALLERTKGTPAGDSLAPSGKALVAGVDSLEGLLVNVKSRTPQDVVNFAPGLNAQYNTLANAADATDAGITGGMRTRFADLEGMWAGLRSRAEGILGAGVAAFNGLVRTRGVEGVVP